MPSKLQKILRFFTDQRGIKGYINNSLHQEHLSGILSKFGITSLPVVSFEDLRTFYKKADLSEIKIKIDFFNGISPPNDYFFLSYLARALDLNKYFEIGTWVGLSAYNLAENTQDSAEIYTLDIPFDHPELRLFNIPEEVYGYYSKRNKKIHHLKCDSKSFDYNRYKKQFELVFVDGNHSYEYVVNDTALAIELIKDRHSVIAWHDYILIEEINKNVLAGILDTVPAEKHKYIYSLLQSNLALYSESFNFKKVEYPKWNIPDLKFDSQFKLIYSNNDRL